jgi:hypothetical protein
MRPPLWHAPTPPPTPASLPRGAREGETHDALSRAADVPLAVARFGAEVAEISARLARADQEGRIDAPRIL